MAEQSNVLDVCVGGSHHRHAHRAGDTETSAKGEDQVKHSEITVFGHDD